MSSLDEMFIAAAGLEARTSDALRLLRLASLIDLADPQASLEVKVTADATLRAVETVLRARGEPPGFPGRVVKPP